MLRSLAGIQKYKENNEEHGEIQQQTLLTQKSIFSQTGRVLVVWRSNKTQLVKTFFDFRIFVEIRVVSAEKSEHTKIETLVQSFTITMRGSQTDDLVNHVKIKTHAMIRFDETQADTR